MPRDKSPKISPTRDLALYERLIADGIAEADARGSAIDHVTARRLALWLMPRSQEEPDFMRGLIRFAQTGAVPQSLRNQLHHHARSPTHPNRPHAARLLQYAVARRRYIGPIGDNFAAICDQIDRADAMLLQARDRVRAAKSLPKQTVRGPRGPDLIAMTRHDADSQTVIFVLDDQTADAAIHAITINAMEREARTREVQQQGQSLPEGSYGRRNREAIVDRETRRAAGLRAIERSYRTALDAEPTPAPELSQLLRYPGRLPEPTQLEVAAGPEIDGELELE